MTKAPKDWISETPARLPVEPDSLRSSAKRQVHSVWTPEPQGLELGEPKYGRESKTTPLLGSCVAEPQLKKTNANKTNKDHHLGLGRLQTSYLNTSASGEEERSRQT